ncbi:MAG: SMP-30/gluconolactonase/LRE family protein [Pseudomonadota bacterium]
MGACFRASTTLHDMTNPDFSLDLGDVRCVADVKATLGEGPLWDPRDGALIWLDIKGRALFRYHPQSGDFSEFPVDGMVSALALRKAGGFVASAKDGFFKLALDEDRVTLTPIIDPEADKPSNRFNDGKADPAGGFWAGTMDNAEKTKSGAFWRLSPEGDASCLIDDFMITNGPAFDTENARVFLTDSAAQTIFVADTDGVKLHNIRGFLKFQENDGYPDGMEVDADGCLWVAFWGAGCIRRFTPSGELLVEQNVPAPQPTSIAIAPDGLYVTSARIGLDQPALGAAPQSGGLFFIPTDRDISRPPCFTELT